jgi:hypothetical protein
MPSEEAPAVTGSRWTSTGAELASLVEKLGRAAHFVVRVTRESFEKASNFVSLHHSRIVFEAEWLKSSTQFVDTVLGALRPFPATPFIRDLHELEDSTRNVLQGGHLLGSVFVGPGDQFFDTSKR